MAYHFSNVDECFYVSCSYLDSVLVIDRDFKIKDQIKISDKINYSDSPCHHINDCYVIENSLFVSMFSRTGNWKLDIFDGTILEYDIKTKKLIGPVISNLWMPHNVKVIQGSLTFLDSLQGHLRSNNAQIIGEFLVLPEV